MANEPWDWKKFWDGMLGMFNASQWGKTIHEILNVRKLLIYVLIIGAVFGWGYIKGIKNKPIHIDSLAGKEFEVVISPNEILHVHKDGTVHIHDAKGNTLKTISVKDIPQLQKALRPMGFQLNPIIVGGYGMTTSATDATFELGAGLSYFKFYRFEADAFLTNKAVYPAAVSYRLQEFGKGNTSVGLAGGLGYEGDKRYLAYLRWEF